MKKLSVLLFFFSFICLLFTPESTCAKSPPNPDNGRLVFKPLLADPLEPRIGTLFNLSKKDLLLDIGSTFDLMTFISDSNSQNKLSFGGHFGTYSLLKRSKNFKFPVDAIDYIFGFNLSYNAPAELFGFEGQASARFRLSHISAHFVDGHVKNGVWDQENVPLTIPFVYSREFINLQGAFATETFKAYLGYQFMFHTIPDDINPHSFQSGLELYHNTCKIPGIYPFVATDFKLKPVWNTSKNKTDDFAGCLNVQLGVKTNPIHEKGMRVVLNYSSGIDHHGMYFYRRISYTSFGVLFHF